METECFSSPPNRRSRNAKSQRYTRWDGKQAVILSPTGASSPELNGPEMASISNLPLLPIWLRYARYLIFPQHRKNLRVETSLFPPSRNDLKYWRNNLAQLLALRPPVQVPSFAVSLSPELFTGSV